MTRLLLVLLPVGLAAVTGCGPATATAAGKVTFQGKPVVWGSVTLKAADGSVHQAGLNPDGSFRLDRVPVGPAKVGVSSPDPKPSPRAKALSDDRVAAATPVAGWFPLPEKFADPNGSGLTVQVGGGPADLDLK